MKTDPDWFAVLELPRRLALGEDEIRQAFHAASREVHPDVGGEREGFERVTQAYGVLRDPVRRLKHFLELEFPEEGGEGRELIGGDLLALFTQVNRAIAAADDVLGRKLACQTALGRAMLATEETRRQRELSEVGVLLGKEIEGAVGEFAELEQLMERDRAIAARRGRDLAKRMSYLAKWTETVRAKFAAFV